MSERPLRWGVLGAADIARKAVLPAIRGAGGELVALASRDLGRARSLAQEFAIPQPLGDYDALLEAEIDAVYIPLPNSLHREWTLRSLAFGRHVLCEKPLGLSRAEALEMGEAAKLQGLVLAEALMYRHHPRWATIRSLLSAGRLGELRHIQGSFSFSLDTGPDIRWQKQLGGGALLDLGSYLVSAARWLAGEPRRVLARSRLRGGVDSQGSLLLEFGAPGEEVDASLSFGFQAVEHQQLLLIGTEAALLIPKPFTAWRGESLPLELQTAPGRAPELIPTVAADPYQEMALNFSQAVHSGSAPATGWEDAALNLAVLDACHRSLRSGAWERPQTISAGQP